MSSFTKSEAIPIKASRVYTKGGIGGFGNYHKSSSVKASPPTPQITITQSSGVFSHGIGGAGNICYSGQEAAITPEEAISRSMIQRDLSSRNCHHGIGGAGNRSIYSNDATSTTLSSSASSNASTRKSSGADRLKEKLANPFQRNSVDSVSLLSAAGLSDRA